MVDLALKILLDDKTRFAITACGVGFAVALVLIQIGLFFGLLDNASITIEKLDADLWVTAKNAANVDFGTPFPETYVQRVRSIPGVARADNLIVWYAQVALPGGAKESAVYYGLSDFAAWRFPWAVESGDPADLRRGDYVLLDRSAATRFGPFAVGDHREFQGRRLKIIGLTREAKSFTTSPMAFLDYDLAQSLSPAELDGQTVYIIARLEPGADAEAIAATIRRRLPYHDVHTRDAWAAQSRRYWLVSTGLGLTIAVTVSLGALVGVVIVAQTLYASTTEHLVEFGTVKAIGGRNREICGIIAEQAAFAALVGYVLGLVLTAAAGPLLDWLDMRLMITPALAGWVFVGTLVLCLGASIVSFRKVASLDPAMVFRG